MHFGGHAKALMQSGVDVAKGQSRNFRRRRRRVMIAVALTSLLTAMLLAIAFFAVMRSAVD